MMPEHADSTRFMVEAAQRATQSASVDEAIQGLLDLLTQEFQLRGALCRAQEGGVVWQSGPVSLERAVVCIIPYRGRTLGNLHVESNGDTQVSTEDPSLQVITWMLATLLHDRELQEAENNVEEYRNRMVRLVIHDLRTPLAQLTGYAHLLQADEPDRPEHTHFIEGIIKAARNMDRMLESLLRLDRVRFDPTELYERVALLPLAHEVISELEPSAEQRGINLTWTLPETDIADVVGDQFLLQRAMENLVSNALKYTLEEGEVHVDLTYTDTYAEFLVTDTGIGIPPDQLGRLFTPFHRTTGQRHVGITGGFGLGLSLVSSIIEQHRGELLVKSEVNKGSKFGFRLPLAPQLHS
jgi:signal transduction histidine kinase